MTLKIDRANPEHVKVRFVLDANQLEGPVSVVGSFNGWVAGLDELLPDADGTRSVTIGLPYGRAACFRYLAANSEWLDEPDADDITTDGSIIHAIEPPRPT